MTCGAPSALLSLNSNLKFVTCLLISSVHKQLVKRSPGFRASRDSYNFKYPLPKRSWNQSCHECRIGKVPEAITCQGVSVHVRKTIGTELSLLPRHVSGLLRHLRTITSAVARGGEGQVAADESIIRNAPGGRGSREDLLILVGIDIVGHSPASDERRFCVLLVLICAFLSGRPSPPVTPNKGSWKQLSHCHVMHAYYATHA